MSISLPAKRTECPSQHGVWTGFKYSQVGEDGILETIFSCIGARSKYYVEFGTGAGHAARRTRAVRNQNQHRSRKSKDGTQCSTRLLREEKGWTGLLLDGGYKWPSLATTTCCGAPAPPLSINVECKRAIKAAGSPQQLCGKGSLSAASHQKGNFSSKGFALLYYMSGIVRYEGLAHPVDLQVNSLFFWIPELNLNQEMITAEDIVQVFEKYAVPKPLLVRKQQLQDRLTGSLSSSATFILHSDFSLLRQADRA
eukprot:scaffold19284_cov19-Tisochrysis_lutea.AAC.1